MQATKIGFLKLKFDYQRKTASCTYIIDRKSFFVLQKH